MQQVVVVGGAMEEGMEKTAADEEVDCSNSRGGRGSWDCWPVEEEDGDGSGMDGGSKMSGLMKLFD